MLFRSNKVDAVATMNIQNSCNGSKPLKADLGLYRLVCSNGLISHTSYSNISCKHDETGYNELYKLLNNLNIHTSSIINEFNLLKQKQLSPEEMMSLAVKASELRFGKDKNQYAEQLLNIVRDEDQNNDLYTVLNRIQENLTQPDRLFNEYGNLIDGVNNINDDIRLNKELFELVTIN